MDDWQDWEECRRNCDKGIQLRHRKIKINQQCKGKGCSSKLVSLYYKLDTTCKWVLYLLLKLILVHTITFIRYTQ